MIGKYNRSEGSLVIDEPISVEITMVDPVTREPLIRLGEAVIDPGATIVWEYPKDGMRWVMS
jgi:hypothetical protein